MHKLLVPDSAAIAALLNEKTGKGEPFEFEMLGITEFDAFRDLKK